MIKNKINGYRRGDTFGIRNHIIAIASVSCVNSFVEEANRIDANIVPITHPHGCDHLGEDREQVLRTLVGTCNHPNVGGVLLIGLGCENIRLKDISQRIRRDNRIVKEIMVQELGKKDKITDVIKKNVSEIKEFVSRQEKEEFDISELIIGLECGGSDTFSAITANPAVGRVSDSLVRLGATVILSEVPEMIGAKDLLENMIEDESVKQKLFSKIDYYVTTALRSGNDLMGVNPTPGNIQAGISSIEEKSLGSLCKAGSSKIQEVVEYAERPSKKGLVVMNTPGNDPESVTGMVAGGAHVVLFTTGLGTPIGNPVAPVIKIASNSRVFDHMQDFIDINAGRILEQSSIQDVAEEIETFLIQVVEGRKTASERNNNREFAINRIGITF